MPTSFKRYFVTKLRRSLPPHLHSLKNIYFVTFSVTTFMSLLLVIPVLVATQHLALTWASLFCAAMVSLTLVLWRLRVSTPSIQLFIHSSVAGVFCYSVYETGWMALPILMWMSLLCMAQVIVSLLDDRANTHSIARITQKNQAIRNMSRDLQATNFDKALFLSTVSHEVRTPLNAVMGYLGLLRNAPHPEPSTEAYIEGAEKSAAHLLMVINDLLDYSQIQQGRLTLNYQTIDLRQLFIDAFQTFMPKASNLEIHYALHLDPNLPIGAHTDPHRLAKIFLNLLGNALKFTSKGSVVAHILYKPDLQKPGTHTLWIKVHDSGIGIPQQALRRIFEPFVQLNPRPTLVNDDALRGNGLGLAITQRLVQNLGGFIHLSSQEGVGSCFEVQLPIDFRESDASSQLKVLHPTQHKNIHVLIVDDHTVNRLVASATIMQALPHTNIDEAHNGMQALAMMKANCYDLVLMDLLMPDLTGIEVVRRIRTECAAPHRHVKVVVLTANASEEAMHQCQEVGIEVLIPKPFDRAMLIQTVLQHTA